MGPAVYLARDKRDVRRSVHGSHAQGARAAGRGAAHRRARQPAGNVLQADDRRDDLRLLGPVRRHDGHRRHHEVRRRGRVLAVGIRTRRSLGRRGDRRDATGCTRSTWTARPSRSPSASPANTTDTELAEVMAVLETLADRAGGAWPRPRLDIAPLDLRAWRPRWSESLRRYPDAQRHTRPHGGSGMRKPGAVPGHHRGTRWHDQDCHLASGVHLFECLIHPWMRTTAPGV